MAFVCERVVKNHQRFLFIHLLSFFSEYRLKFHFPVLFKKQRSYIGSLHGRAAWLHINQGNEYVIDVRPIIFFFVGRGTLTRPGEHHVTAAASTMNKN